MKIIALRDRVKEFVYRSFVISWSGVRLSPPAPVSFMSLPSKIHFYLPF